MFDAIHNQQADDALIPKGESQTQNHGTLSMLIEYAEFLLVGTDRPLEQIARQCGWTDENEFANAFEREIGVTPQHYRNWHRFTPDPTLI